MAGLASQFDPYQLSAAENVLGSTLQGPGGADTPTFAIPTNTPNGIGGLAGETTTYTPFNPASDPLTTETGLFDVLQGGVATPAALLGGGSQQGPNVFYPPTSNYMNVQQQGPGGGGFPAIPLTPPTLSQPNVPTLNFGTIQPQSLPPLARPNAPMPSPTGSPIAFSPGGGGSFGAPSGGGGSNIAPGGGASGPPQAPQNLANPYGLGFGGPTPSGVPGGAPNSVTVPTPHGPVSFPMPNVGQPQNGSPMLSGNISQNRNLIAQGLPGGGNGPISDATGPASPLAYQGPGSQLSGLRATPGALNPQQNPVSSAALKALSAPTPKGQASQDNKSPEQNLGRKIAQQMFSKLGQLGAPKNITSPEDYQQTLTSLLGGRDSTGQRQPGLVEQAVATAFKPIADKAAQNTQDAKTRLDSIAPQVDDAIRAASYLINPYARSAKIQELADAYARPAKNAGLAKNFGSAANAFLHPIQSSLHAARDPYIRYATAEVDNTGAQAMKLLPFLQASEQSALKQYESDTKFQLEVQEKQATATHQAQDDVLTGMKAMTDNQKQNDEHWKMQAEIIEKSAKDDLDAYKADTTAQAKEDNLRVREQIANIRDRLADIAEQKANTGDTRENRLEGREGAVRANLEAGAQQKIGSAKYLEFKRTHDVFGNPIAPEPQAAVPEPQTPEQRDQLAEAYKAQRGVYPPGYTPNAR